jgi:hypothetical protein
MISSLFAELGRPHRRLTGPAYLFRHDQLCVFILLAWKRVVGRGKNTRACRPSLEIIVLVTLLHLKNTFISHPRLLLAYLFIYVSIYSLIEAESVREAAWGCDWVGTPVPFQSCLAFIIAIANKEFTLTAGKFVPVCNSTMMNVRIYISL